jgi:phosphopantothenoylcysteine decarboxylase/phosphopantothenate--cysteine ligase
MNNYMYEHPATQANLTVLRERGVHLIDPGRGALASRGEWGIGRLADPEQVLAAIELIAGTGTPRPLDGTRVLVTAGGTREPVDPVRFIGNRSSGQMGFALAEEAARRGAGVTVIAANVQLPRMTGISYLDVETAAELRAAAFERFADCDVLLMAAAIADYRPAEPAPGKIDKERHEALSLELVRTDDVLAELSGLRRPDQTLVGFAAEHGDRAIERARAKLERKGLDLIVFNDISRTDIGFDSPENEVTIVDRAHDLNVSRRSKRSVAEAVLDRVQELRGREASTRYSKEGL